VLSAADRVRVRQETRPDREGRAAGSRRPGRPEGHRHAPNVIWLTDITEHRTAEAKLYLCAIKDVYSGRIVGYSIDSGM
jgi:transposase InsO family protein